MASAAHLRLVYFLYYGSVGTLMPYFGAYLRGLGYRGGTIGSIQMIPSLVAPVAAMGWATFADHHATPSRALRLATAWAAFAVVFLPLARAPWQFGAVMAALTAGSAAVVPLADSTAIELCHAQPGLSYARIRLFGSVGFIALSLSVGRLLTLRGDRAADVLVPLVVVATVAGYAWVARGAPQPPHRGERPAPGALLDLARDRRLLLFLGACAFHWAACAPYHLFFGVHVRDLGLPADVTGIGMGVGVVAEIVVLLAYPRIERRASQRLLFSIAFLGSTVRWLLMARATGAVTVAALQAFHGLSFGLFWGTAMRGMAELIPSRLRATGQALFTAVVFGGGNAAGYWLAGVGYDRLGGARPVYAAAAVAELLALAVVLLPRGRLRHATPK
ncbi:MAG TPA: MFS transporter [Anaeromyxobacteraceae bacterium]|nr:MFS transporter [Anaeromyxobacteraceae bacterium]